MGLGVDHDPWRQAGTGSEFAMHLANTASQFRGTDCHSERWVKPDKSDEMCHGCEKATFGRTPMLEFNPGMLCHKTKTYQVQPPEFLGIAPVQSALSNASLCQKHFGSLRVRALMCFEFDCKGLDDFNIRL